MYDPPFWKTELEEKYSRWWIPSLPERCSVSFSSTTTESWFSHVQYKYPSGSNDKLLQRNPSTTKLTETERDKEDDNEGKKDALSGEKRKVLFASKKVVPADKVLRVVTMRFFPTKDQQRVLKKWLSAARHTYNWALSVLKDHFTRKLKIIKPSNRVSLKMHFVTCHKHRFPRRLRWMRKVPYSIREEATKELSLAYAAAFRRRENGSRGTFDDIKFRSIKNSKPATITIPTQNFSKKSGCRWDIFLEVCWYFPEGCWYLCNLSSTSAILRAKTLNVIHLPENVHVLGKRYTLLVEKLVHGIRLLERIQR